MYPIKKLSEITSLITKWSTPTTYGYSFLSEWINFIKIENISNGVINKFSISAFISLEAHLFQKRSTLEDWDFLVSIAWTIGSIALVTKDILPANTNQALAIVRGYWNFVNKDFLRYIFLSSLSNWFKNKARGGALQNISLEDIKNIEIPLPPLSTQSRIVTRLDSAFANIDEQIALLRANIADVEGMRRSTLEGFILEESNFKNLEELMTANNLWLVRWQSEQSDQFEIFYIKMNNLWNFNGRIILDKLTKVNVSKFEKEKYLLRKWDFLFNTRNSFELVWKTAMFDMEWDYLFNNNILRIRFMSEVSPEYINYIFLTAFIQNQLHRMKSGTTNVSAIYFKNLKKLKIPLLSISRQHEVVAYLDRVFAETTLLRGDYEAQIRDLEILKQSLLEEAFTGRLVTE